MPLGGTLLRQPLISKPETGTTARHPLITLADLVAVVYCYPVVWLTRLCPDVVLRVLERVCSPGYQWLRRADRSRVAAVIRNWRDIPAGEAELVARRLFRNIVRRARIEMAVMAGRDTVAFEVVGREHLDRALAGGAGLLLTSPHSLGMRLARVALARAGYPSLVVLLSEVPPGLGRAGRKWVAPRYLNLIWKMQPNRIRASDPDLAMTVARHIRAGGIVHITPDGGRASREMRVPFLHGEARIYPGVLDLARLCRCPVVPFAVVLTEKGCRVEVRPPLELRLDGTADECRAANLPVLVREIEQQVREHPEEWELWINRKRDA